MAQITDKWIIYLITNKIDGKQYIGQTRRDLDTRIAEHIRDSATNSYIDRALKIYGPDNFSYDIITTVYTQEEADLKERYYIEYFNTYNTGYNCTRGGAGTTGTQSGRHDHSVSVLHVDDDLNVIERFDTILEAATKLDIPTRNMYRVLNKFMYEYSEGYWCRESDFDILKENKPNKNEYYQQNHVYKLYTETLLIAEEFESQKAAAMSVGVSPGDIGHCCDLKGWTCAGWAWCRVEDYGDDWIEAYYSTRQTKNQDKSYAVVQIDKDDNVIGVYNSLTEAASKTGIYRQGITACCNGKQQSCGGYKWEYYDIYYEV